MDGKPLAICGICGCDPCDCHGWAEIVKMTYKIGNPSFPMYVPKRLVERYISLYNELEVMSADGSVVVYSSGVVRERNNEN